MSSTGIEKARSPEQRTSDNTRDITKQIIDETKVFNATSPAFALSGESGSSEGSAAGNYLAKSGDIRLGPMGNEFRIVEIIDDTISVSISTANYVPMIILTLEGGVPSDLVTIIPGESVFLNQEILLQGGNETEDITLKNSGNIITPDGGDLAIAFGDIVRLYYSQLLSAWVVAWFSSNVGGGGSGDVTFPIDFPEEQRGTVGFSTEIIDFEESDRHSVIMELNGDIGLSLINTTADTLQLSSIKLKQDGTGGHAFIGFSQAVGNEQVIIDAVNNNNGPNDFTEFVVEFSDGLFTAYLKTGNIVTGGGGTNNLSDLLINIASKDWLAQGISNFGSLTGVTAVQYVDTGSVVRGSMFGDTGNSALGISLASGGKLQISDITTPILEIDNTSGLKMFKNIIPDTAGTLDLGTDLLHFDRVKSRALELFGSLSNPTDASDTGIRKAPSKMAFNVENTSDDYFWFFDGISEWVMSNTNFAGPQVTLNSALVINDSASDPSFNGEFRRNGADVLVFTGGVPVNLSDLGASNIIFEGNSSVLVTDIGIDADAKIEFILNGGVVGGFTPVSFLPIIPIDMTTAKDIIGIGKTRFTSNTDVIVDTEASIALRDDNFEFNVENTSDQFHLKFNGTLQHSFTNSTLTSPNIITNNILIINDSTTLPTGNGVFSRDGTVLGLQIPEFAIRRTTTTDTDLAELSLVKVDASPDNDDAIAALNYSIEDNGAITQYAQTRAEIRDTTDAGRYYISVRANNSLLVDAIEIIGDDNNVASFMNINARISSDLIFGQESGSTDLQIRPAVNNLGFTVSTETLTVGASGSMKMPVDTGDAINAATADTDFGDVVGCFGVYLSGGGTPLFVIKMDDSPTTWATLTLNASGTISASRLT